MTQSQEIRWNEYILSHYRSNLARERRQKYDLMIAMAVASARSFVVGLMLGCAAATVAFTP